MNPLKTMKLAGLSILTGLGIATAVSASAANLMAQRCSLGQSCPIPGDDNGITYYTVTPDTGTSYKCTITADKDTLIALVHGGKDFAFSPDVYRANPRSTGTISGHFLKSKNTTGQIKIRRLNSGTGQVICFKN